jgi:hypothetical protein
MTERTVEPTTLASKNSAFSGLCMYHKYPLLFCLFVKFRLQAANLLSFLRRAPLLTTNHEHYMITHIPMIPRSPALASDWSRIIMGSFNVRTPVNTLSFFLDTFGGIASCCIQDGTRHINVAHEVTKRIRPCEGTHNQKLDL